MVAQPQCGGKKGSTTTSSSSIVHVLNVVGALNTVSIGNHKSYSEMHDSG